MTSLIHLNNSPASFVNIDTQSTFLQTPSPLTRLRQVKECLCGSAYFNQHKNKLNCKTCGAFAIET